MKRIALLPLALCLTACDPHGFRAARQAVRERLKDPDAAKFTDLRQCVSGKGVIGFVNSKNSYGGYAGSERFIYIFGSVIFPDQGDSALSLEAQECYGTINKKKI